jgi:hypothetical protein
MWKRYKPPSIIEALKPYHYPEDQDGNPIPTPSPRNRPQVSSTSIAHAALVVSRTRYAP